MSTSEQRRAAETAKTKEDARAWACAVCRDFISDWDRVSSIICWMEDAANAAAAQAKDGELCTWIPETFAANTYWLREQLETKAALARKSLADAGMACEPLI